MSLITVKLLGTESSLTKMVAKSKLPTDVLLYSFDAGNGSCKGVSTETRAPIQFAPVIAPITDKRAVDKADEKPTFSLKVDKQVLVFGVDDVYEHGKRAALRRLNSIDRYTTPDYFRLLDVLYLQCFAAYRTKPDYITPTGCVSLPVSQYNTEETVNNVRDSLLGKRELSDYDGCTLRIDIQPKRLTILPESYGALMHWAYDPQTLRRRPGIELNGTTLVIDIGYETTDCSLFEGAKFQRDRAITIPRAGMGIVARAIQEYASKQLKSADVSRIDRAMAAIAGIPPGAIKRIEAAPGIMIDVTDVYDQTLSDVAQRIAQGVETEYAEAVNRALLAGGGALHLEQAIGDNMGAPIVVAPDADLANVIGAFTGLQLKAQQAV